MVSSYIADGKTFHSLCRYGANLLCLLALAIGWQAVGTRAAAQEAGNYRIVTGPVGSQDYVIGVGITSLIKLQLLPSKGIDLNPAATSGLLESFSMLNGGEADFGLLSAVWSDLGAIDGDVQAVATLKQEGDRSIQLMARRGVDPEVVYDVTKTIFENLGFLKTLDGAMAETSLDHALEGMTLSLHEGARRYFEQVEALPSDVASSDAQQGGLEQAGPEQAGAEQAGGAQGDAQQAQAPVIAENPPSDPASGSREPRVVTSKQGMTFVIYFDFDSVTIKDEGAAVLDQLAALGPELQTSTVWIAGYTDTTGVAEYNLALGQRRVDAVTEALRQRGVTAREFYAAAFGERSPWVKTGDETEEARNRRVEIFVERNQTAPADAIADEALIDEGLDAAAIEQAPLVVDGAAVPVNAAPAGGPAISVTPSEATPAAGPGLSQDEPAPLEASLPKQPAESQPSRDTGRTRTRAPIF